MGCLGRRAGCGCAVGRGRGCGDPATIVRAIMTTTTTLFTGRLQSSRSVRTTGIDNGIPQFRQPIIVADHGRASRTRCFIRLGRRRRRRRHCWCGQNLPKRVVRHIPLTGILSSAQQDRFNPFGMMIVGTIENGHRGRWWRGGGCFGIRRHSGGIRLGGGGGRCFGRGRLDLDGFGGIPFREYRARRSSLGEFTPNHPQGCQRYRGLFRGYGRVTTLRRGGSGHCCCCSFHYGILPSLGTTLHKDQMSIESSGVATQMIAQQALDLFVAIGIICGGCLFLLVSTRRRSS